MVVIKPYKQEYQNAIDTMLMLINNEFEVTIFSKNHPTSYCKFSKYWVAYNGKELVGTIAILNIDNKASVLKSLFVKKEFRGKTSSTSHQLLQTAVNWCISENRSNIYLGTMEQFIAAHKFYEKNGFQKIEQFELPIGFIHNPIDTVFYKKRLDCKKFT